MCFDCLYGVVEENAEALHAIMNQVAYMGGYAPEPPTDALRKRFLLASFIGMNQLDLARVLGKAWGIDPAINPAYEDE